MESLWRRVAQSPQLFESCAVELFAFQAQRCEPYRRYLELIECDPTAVKSVAQIPFMPIELFKHCDVYCAESAPEVVFTSSATTGSVQSRHAMPSLSHYEQVAVAAFELQFGALSELSIYALLPGYLEREGSSLIYMVERFIDRSAGGGFFLRNHDELIKKLTQDDRPKLLLAVSYALLDLAERGELHLENTIVMETGGMKGQRRELPKSELHKTLRSALNVEKIASEYGMAELTSQAYSLGDGLFTTPPWMRVVI
ncbi:MAG: acyltransferase, partial [Rikenellaceae bacterium]